MPPKLGILAGSGDLPSRLAATCRATGREVFVLAFEGQTDPQTVEGVPHAWTRLGAGGSALKLLHETGVEEIVMAGPIRRPSFTALRPDARTAMFLARVAGAAWGDDGILSAVVRELEKEGFRVVGIDSLLEDLLAPEGCYGRLRPDDEAWDDIRRGLTVVRAIGALDIGQAVVIQQGFVLGVEAAEGTDALIRRCGPLQREGSRAVLVKTRKPGQERRVDLPTIGPETVANAAEAGLGGIAVEARGALVVDREAVGRIADDAGLFVVGIADPM